MGAIKETIDFSKELLGAIKDHQKNEDKDRYIHVLEDLSTKVCLENEQIKKENEKLKKTIYDYEHPEFEYKEEHARILYFIKSSEMIYFSIAEIKKHFNNELDYEIAIHELIDNYLIEESSTEYIYAQYYELNEDYMTDILKIIKKFKDIL